MPPVPAAAGLLQLHPLLQSLDAATLQLACWLADLLTIALPSSPPHPIMPCAACSKIFGEPAAAAAADAGCCQTPACPPPGACLLPLDSSQEHTSSVHTTTRIHLTPQAERGLDCVP